MNKRVLTVQDISCVGQCSLTVALPVLSACGVEAAVLPSAVLSTHTGGGFAGYTFRDLTADMPAIVQHWQKEGFRFDAVYTGYLGSGEQITHVRHIMDTLLVPGGARIIDPAMADNGKLYAGFDAAFVEKMKTLAFSADILLPNITEAALLTGMEYRKEYDEAYIEELTAALHEKGVGTVVLTGVSYEPETTGEEKKEPDEAAQPALDFIRETLGAKVDGVKGACPALMKKSSEGDPSNTMARSGFTIWLVTTAPRVPTSSCAAKAPTTLTAREACSFSSCFIVSTMHAQPARLSNAFPKQISCSASYSKVTSGIIGSPIWIPKTFSTSSRLVAPTSTYIFSISRV